MTPPSFTLLHRPVEQRIVVSRLVMAAKDLPGLVTIGFVVAMVVFS